VRDREKRKLARDFVADLPPDLAQFRKHQARIAENPTSQVSINCKGEESLSGAIFTVYLTELLTLPRIAFGAASIERRALGERSVRTVPCQSFLNS
jgi:hypothetical protein